MSYDKITREHARLIMLRVLHQEANGSLNSAMLQEHLEAFGISKPREWVHDELRWLSDMGAVNLREVASVRIATLLTKGSDHVERRIIIEGVKRPGRPEA